MQAGLLLAEVRELRANLPSIGIDVIHYKLTDFRQSHGIKIGRNKLANRLIDNGLLIIKRGRRVKTTWSHHRYFKYPTGGPAKFDDRHKSESPQLAMGK